MVYLADHPALAVLEVLVHLDRPPEDLPDDYIMLRVRLPDDPPPLTGTDDADPRWSIRWFRLLRQHPERRRDAKPAGQGAAREQPRHMPHLAAGARLRLAV